MSKRIALILAAGKSRRLKSKISKPLHKIGGKLMIDWVTDLARSAKCDEIITVVNDMKGDVASHLLRRDPDAKLALQAEQNGTGHAVQCAGSALKSTNKDHYCIILCADAPLVDPKSLFELLEQLEQGADLALLGFECPHENQYGRLCLDKNGQIQRIIETRDVNEKQRKITLCNSGVIGIAVPLLYELLDHVKSNNVQGEVYLTDIFELAYAQGLKSALVMTEEERVTGVNSREELALAEQNFQHLARREIMRNGVTLLNPESVTFSHDTKIARDVTIHPHVVIGPGVEIDEDSVIHAFCHLEGCKIDQNCSVGPYARLRPGTELKKAAKIGNFVETKNSVLGEGAKASHLSYIGDSEVGESANIGAGTITCNYDGFGKYKTRIGAGAFIGSNSSLVAPVTIGVGAMTGSGSVISKNVPDHALALERSDQENKSGWAEKFRAMKKRNKEVAGAKKTG